MYYYDTSQSVKAPTDYVPVYTLVGPNGDFGNGSEAGGEAYCLSVNDKNTDASMDIISYLNFNPQGTILNTIGVEGVHYSIQNNEIVPNPTAVSAGYTINIDNFANSWSNMSIKDLGHSIQGVDEKLLETQLKDTQTAYAPNNLGKVRKVPAGLSELYDENMASYNNNMYEMATKIVMGSQTIDQAYSDYAKFWASIQGGKMLEQLNATLKK
jgi:hypothetical protein